MLVKLFTKYEQALTVAGCAITSVATLGWMTTDIHLREKKTIMAKYQDKINLLEQENKGLKDLIQARSIQF